VDVAHLGDPAPGCSKDFSVEYSCAPDTTLARKLLLGEAGLKSQLELSCLPLPGEPVVTSGLRIRTATYGGNCGAPSGNVTRDVAQSCSGRPDCNYVVDVDHLGDPARGCGKDFLVEYSCAPDEAVQQKGLPAEAGLKSSLQLDCARAVDQPTPAAEK
jgi:hypothetical protein